jgi:plastocyanin
MRMRTCIGLAGLIFALIVFLSVPGRAADRTRSGANAVVTIDNFSFTPQTLTVKVGTRVTWTNHDDIPHAIMSEDAEFHSKALDTDDSFSFTPTKAGTYSYFCSLHPKMTAKIVVE